MFESNVNTLFSGQLAHHAFEAVGAVINDVIGTDRFGFFRFYLIADRGDHGGADTGATGLDQNGLAGPELGIVEQHVLHGAECNWRASCVAITDIVGNRHDQPGRHVYELAGKTVDMETHDARDVFAEIVAAGAARFAGSASQRPIGDDAIARPARGYIGTDPGDFAGGFDANNEWQRALGKGHAAPAPDINVVESDRFDADLNFAAAGLRRCRNIAKLDLAIGNQRERAHRSAS